MVSRPFLSAAPRHLIGRIGALLAFALLPLAAPADTLPPPVAAALRQAGIPAAHVGLAVQAVDGPHPALAWNTAKPFNPASVMKLVTTYSALRLLGPTYTWETALLADAPPANGTLAGNLYLRGSGDPALTQERFWLLLRQLRARGVETLQGDLVLDRSAYRLPPHDPAAFDHEPLRPYNVGPDALLLNLQSLRISLEPDPAHGRLQQTLETPLAGLTVRLHVAPDFGECGDWREKLVIDYRPTSATLDVGGAFPLACGPKPLFLSPLDSNAYVEAMFRALWQELGGRFLGRVRSGTTPPQAQPLTATTSPALAEVIRETNKFSNNVMARQIFLTLGRGEGAPNQTPPPATPEGARQHIGTWLTENGLAMPELVLDNGSGLSRDERIGAGSLLRLLVQAWHSPVQPEFAASLPLAGWDGTLRRRFKETAFAGRAHLKTGSLANARAWAGYLTDRRGRNWALVLLINDPKAGAGWDAAQALLDWTLTQGDRP